MKLIDKDLDIYDCDGVHFKVEKEPFTKIYSIFEDVGSGWLFVGKYGARSRFHALQKHTWGD